MEGAYSFKPGGPRPAARPLSRVLRVITVLCTIFTFLAVLLIFVSGTSTREENNKILINMSELSLVEFSGIITKSGGNGTDAYAVKMYHFPAGFGWEYANATKKEQTGGLIYTGADDLKVPGDFRRVAEKLGLPNSDYQCLGRSTVECTNPFFQAWRYKDGNDQYSTTVHWIFCFMVFLTIFITLVKELFISCAKSTMGCHCPIGKSLCPAPKCSRDRLNYLAPSVWDSYRCYWYTFSASMTIACGITLTIRSHFLAKDLRDRKIASAQIGRGFLIIMWGAAIVMTIGALLMYISRALNRRAERGLTFPSPDKSPAFAPVTQFQPAHGYPPQPQVQTVQQPVYTHQPQWKQTPQVNVQ
ncbi:hypothetical protein MGG_10487 [Pyricularia oryzae 70-15]|uniref:Uncharacterized protein n=3 Tax=Pyricularia oryzae TaxID=318829 RepID=G4MYG4_PYRO7|nr:uncharacterized protein MGG_10487 [Pyricularia oryzae 70-15]EHA53584.1 hypothetical protein MGG_10487 [Pyricularia oryzae 70-15]ELQ38511.1 hypothetical protein OOU_Y34scaffold00535g8 [Pyricularia oryzae Y34]KAI7915354.1 hypothetical protein M9X92_008464 [Pyricularia oryzae]KAI7917129.1 hypothetical protein M0657_008250 [Pyricularia oryzae]